MASIRPGMPTILPPRLHPPPTHSDSKVSSADTLELIGRRLLDMAADHKIPVWAMIQTPLAISIPTRQGGEFRNPAFRFRDGHQRSRQGTTRACLLREGPDVGLALDVRGVRAHMASRFSTAFTTTSKIPMALPRGMCPGLRARIRRQDAHSPEPDRDVQEAFSPTPGEVEQARKIIAAFDLPENKGKGVVSIDGRMVERLHAEMARRTVAIAGG